MGQPSADDIRVGPLRVLNDRGLALAAEWSEPTRRQSFRLVGQRTPSSCRHSPAEFARLKAESKRCGVTMTDIINAALAEYRERRS